MHNLTQMKVLIKNARIVCSASPFHGKIKDILIIDGKIETIANDISQNAEEIIIHDNLHVSIGWMDIFSDFGDPGFEQKETIETGSAAAAAGGFTDVMITPNTNPTASTKTQVEYIIQKSKSFPVNVYPIASITKNTEGKELAEMYDMHMSGAIAFSDGTQTIQSPGVFLKALQYLLPLNATLIQLPDDKSVSSHGLINEGIISTRIGLPGRPAIAEELMIARDIELLKYTNSKLHLTGISTRKGIGLITRAKEQGLNLTFSVTPYHCFFCDEQLEDYDTNLKVNPPLRTKDDMIAVREAFITGTADCIASHHMPRHWDDKTCEFEYAKYGMIGLESLFGVMNSLQNNTTHLINQLTLAPRKIFGLPVSELKEGQEACLTLFNPDETYIFDESMIRSKSRNTAFIGKKLKGRVIGIINRGKVIINHKYE